jgi:hypothetical protein
MRSTTTSIVRNWISIAVLVASLGCRSVTAKPLGVVGTSTTSSASALDVASIGKDPRWNAPIGHRQPRLRDLPSEAPGELEHISEEDRALDRRLIICRGC